MDYYFGIVEKLDHSHDDMNPPDAIFISQPWTEDSRKYVFSYKLNDIKFKHGQGLNMIGHLIKEHLKTTKEDSVKLLGFFNDPDSGMLEQFRGQKLHGEGRGERTAWHVYSAATAFLRDREEDGRLDDVVNKRQSLANLFGGIASGKREINPLLVPHAKIDIKEFAM